jgi:predicted dehydrogenase
LDENYIGVVKQVNIQMLKQPSKNCGSADNWRVFPELAGGGLFYDLAPHQLDLVFFYFGDAISFHGKSENKAGLYPAEDFVQGSMQLNNNIVFSGVWDFTVPPALETDVFEIVGEKGKISFPVFGSDITINKNGEVEVIHFDPPMHNQQNLIDQVVQYFLGNSVNPCSASDALQSMRVMEAFVYGNK